MTEAATVYVIMGVLIGISLTLGVPLLYRWWQEWAREHKLLMASINPLVERVGRLEREQDSFEHRINSRVSLYASHANALGEQLIKLDKRINEWPTSNDSNCCATTSSKPSSPSSNGSAPTPTSSKSDAAPAPARHGSSD